MFFWCASCIGYKCRIVCVVFCVVFLVAVVVYMLLFILVPGFMQYSHGGRGLLYT